MKEALILLAMMAFYTSGFFVALCQAFGYYSDKGEEERFAFYRACDLASFSWLIVLPLFCMGIEAHNKAPWRWYWK